MIWDRRTASLAFVVCSTVYDPITVSARISPFSHHTKRHSIRATSRSTEPAPAQSQLISRTLSSSYMPSEPTTVSTEASSPVLSEIHTANLQHGLRDDHEPGTRLLPLEGERVDPRCVVDETDASTTSSTDSDKTMETPLRRLRTETSSLRTRSSVARIAEYENALKASPKKGNEGPRFKVVEKKHLRSRDESLSIAAFPNGRLSDGSVFISKLVRTN